MGSLRNLGRDRPLKFPVTINVDLHDEETSEIEDWLSIPLLREIRSIYKSRFIAEFYRSSIGPTRGIITLLSKDENGKVHRIFNLNVRAKTYDLGKKMERFFFYLREKDFEIRSSISAPFWRAYVYGVQKRKLRKEQRLLNKKYNGITKNSPQ
jgi:hypothetical protein